MTMVPELGSRDGPKRNVPDSLSLGTLAWTALPQVLLACKSTFQFHACEWHGRAMRKRQS